jgi:hypothetical protein
MSQMRVFGDPANVRRKLRRVIKRGQAILDELEGGRQRTRPDADSEGNSLSRDTAVSQGQRAIVFWSRSITSLLSLHMPSMTERFDKPLPEPERGVPSHDLLDSFDTYIRTSVEELETLLERLTNEGTT